MVDEFRTRNTPTSDSSSSTFDVSTLLIGPKYQLNVPIKNCFLRHFVLSLPVLVEGVKSHGLVSCRRRYG